MSMVSKGSTDDIVCFQLTSSLEYDLSLGEEDELDNYEDENWELEDDESNSQHDTYDDPLSKQSSETLSTLSSKRSRDEHDEEDENTPHGVSAASPGNLWRSFTVRFSH